MQHANRRTAVAAILLVFLTSLAAVEPAGAQAGNQPPPFLSDLVDVSRDYTAFTNEFYVADRLTGFDPATASGQVTWMRNQLVPLFAFDNMRPGLKPFPGSVFPAREYPTNPSLPFSLQFISPRTVRIRMGTGSPLRRDGDSLMFVKAPGRDASWKYEKTDGGHRYTSAFGSVTLKEQPWRVEFRDAHGRLLTHTQHTSDYATTFVAALPFAYVRRSGDFSRGIAPVFSLSPGEKIFGGGESFTRLDKRGQKLVLWANDANGAQTDRMYKPIPFLLSDRGYGLFVHTSAPATFDIGSSFHGSNTLMLGDDEADVFVFLGGPKDVLAEYTALTGRPSMPPLWSFGFWMSRITYTSEAEVRTVAARLRAERIPSDVIHLDTGWFETDWRCDYTFSPTRFKDPKAMIADLGRDGFHVSLWQLPYFVPKNALFQEIVDKKLAVRDARGNLPFDDAVLDFSNPATVTWYQDKIAGLLRLGVGVIKVDFGEAAPMNGQYASGQTGFFEHNLYPLRYNKTVADITKQVTGDSIIWARSAWAGSQRYPLHWGGDAGNSDMDMLATLRGGLSLGLSGFSFWSHDIGGFAVKTPEELYRRWLPFGMLSSHSRSHGAPPKEPWEYGPAFTDAFRRSADLRYRLMPYIYAQAKDSSDRGLPMVRALFVEFPDDPGAWSVEDEYLFGADLLVAPIMEGGTTARDVYLPGGNWFDYQTGRPYKNGWHRIEGGTIPAVILVREGAAIPHAALAQSTSLIDWSKLELVVYGPKGTKATGLYCLPADNLLRTIGVDAKGALAQPGPTPAAAITWTVRRSAEGGGK